MDFPAWPAFLSTRRSRGLGLLGRVCCNSAANLNECMGTTRSSSRLSMIHQERKASCEQRKPYGQRSKAVSAAESYSRVRYVEAIMEICSQNRVGHLGFRSHLSKLSL